VLQTTIDTQELIRSLVRLRRAERRGDDMVATDLEPVVAYLEQLVGPTVSRAEAARLLGISHTALNRWVEKGDIAAVPTPRGRVEIPLSQMLDLLEEIERRSDDDERATVAAIIRDRRRKAAAIDDDQFLAPRRRPPRTHRAPELHALAYHRVVASRLDQKTVTAAGKRLRRWSAEGRIDPRWAREWERVLAQPVARIARLISADTKQARELRQTSPFAGELTEQERRRVRQAVEERLLA
jgi:hypothetical protein